MALERVDLVILAEAKTFRLSSFAAAIQLNGSKCFELESPQPHNLVTCQPRHVSIVAAIRKKRSDRTTQIENLVSKREERNRHIKFRSPCHMGQLRFLYLLPLLYPSYRGVHGRYALNAGTSSLCATVRDHLRSCAPESPRFFPLPRIRVPGIFVLRFTRPHTGPLLKDDYTSFWGVPFN